MNNKQPSGSLSNLEISAFCGQMAMILRSGISAMEGLSIMLDDARNDKETAIITSLKAEMENSGWLHEAIKASRVFPIYMVRMIRLGEETGTLDEVMRSLETHYTREDNLARTIKNALTYPMIMIVMMLVVIIVLITQVMPIFNQVFRQLGQEMTGFSGGVLRLGETLSSYAVVFVVIAALLVAFVIYATRTVSGKAMLRKIGQHFSFARRIYEKTAACRFADGMALTLRSGMSPEQGLSLAGDLVEDPYFHKKVEQCMEKVRQGEDLSHSLQETGIFTGVYARMASIAGRTGVMDEIMTQIASEYENDVDVQITSVIAALEPTLVIVLSVIVGAILFSVMLPLLGIMAGV